MQINAMQKVGTQKRQENSSAGHAETVLITCAASYLDRVG